LNPWKNSTWGSAPRADNVPPGPWLSGIVGTKLIGSISIPGTHDSASIVNEISGFAQNQVLTIPDQLIAGIRYLDIRCRHFNDEFPIHHGSIYQKLNFDDVLKSVTKFLELNPTEVVLMRVKEEYKPAGNTQSFQETFNSYFIKDAYLRFFWKMNTNINNPPLDEVRGKILIIQDFSSPIRYGPSFNQFFVQDNYNPQKPDRIPKKKDSILENLNYAQRTGATMFINHLSCYSSQVPFLTPKKMSKTINPYMIDLITQKKPNYVGIIPSDFPESDLIYTILRTNEEFQQFQVRS